MIKEIFTRFKQGYRTIKFPKGKPPVMPEKFRGAPQIDYSLCKEDCDKCRTACPTGAIVNKSIDLGKCLFCTDCINACSSGAVSFSADYRLSVSKRQDLLISEKDKIVMLGVTVNKKIKRIFGRSLKLREVSAGGCNACEADTNVLGTIGWDLGRFGIQFVASPRHADGLLITGPVTENMKLALLKTYEAVPDPKVVIVVGSCAISGGPFSGHKEVNNGVEDILPVDLFIPGCPPHPLTILDGLLRFLGRIKE